MTRETNLKKLIGMSKRDFDSCISGGTINLRRARLIPVAKLGDEVALTSVILSAIKLVDVYGFMYNEMVAGQVIKGLPSICRAMMA